MTLNHEVTGSEFSYVKHDILYVYCLYVYNVHNVFIYTHTKNYVNCPHSMILLGILVEC